jgi:hypothetical protein
MSTRQRNEDAGQHWIAVTLPGAGEVHIAVPVGSGRRDADAAAIAEAQAFAAGLMRQGRIHVPGQADVRGTTHEIVDDDDGRRWLVRRRFG